MAAAVADAAVVTDVGADHDQAIIADDGGGIVGPAAVNRDVLANAVVVTDDQRASRIVDMHVLRPAADDRTFADFVAAAEGGASLHGGSGFEHTIIAEYGPGLHDGERGCTDMGTMPPLVVPCRGEPPARTTPA